MREGRSEYRCRVYFPGCVTGEALVIRRPISFLGEVNSRTGDYLIHPDEKINLAGKVLIIPYAKGSAGGSRILLQLVKQKRHPIAIVTVKEPDTILTEGAILGKVPLVCCEDRTILDDVKSGDRVSIHDKAGIIIIERSAGY